MQTVKMERCLWIWCVETTMMKSFRYYAWYSISYLLFFHFIDHNLYEFVWFFKLCKYYVRSICTKGKREKIKHVMNLVMIQWKFFVSNTHFLLLHCGLHSLKVLHNKWCSLHYVWVTWKEAIERFSEPKKDGSDIVINVLMYFFFWLRK